MSRPLKSALRPFRVPRSVRSPQEDENVERTSRQSDSNLPPGWTFNDKDEILNDEGLVMMDIQEELPPQENQRGPQTKNFSSFPGSSPLSVGTHPHQQSSDPVGNSGHQLPSHISQLLDKLELEEALETSRQQEDSKDSEPNELEPEGSSNYWVTPAEVEQELNKTINSGTNAHPSYCSKEADQELKSWGKTGLDGLKNIFKASSTAGPSNSRLPDQVTSAVSPVTTLSSTIASTLKTEKDSQADPIPPKSRQKKSVTFTPDTYSPPPKTVSAPETSRPSPGIMLSDIVEHPIPSPPAVPLPSIHVSTSNKKNHQINGKNAHLNPRLASLLPRSLQTPTPPNSNEIDGNLELQESDDSEISEQDQDDFDCGEGDDSSSLWSEDDGNGEGDSNWPPEELDIQTALDLRQAALEYHTRRQGLGLGSGTGPLGGDRPPMMDEETEWVPIEARVQAPGVARQSNGQSRFKSGRPLPPWDGSTPACLNDEKVVNGKLFGTAPIVDGPAPTKGAAVHRIPGRKADFGDLDDELTAEELELLKSRLEVLGMDEESRIAAEQAGTALMTLMEKARTGEINLEDEVTNQSDSKLFLASNPTAHQEGPPEVKTAPKKRSSVPAKNISAASSCDTQNSALVESSRSQPNDSGIYKAEHIANIAPSNAPLNPMNDSSGPVAEPAPPATKKISRFKASKLSQNQ